MNHFFNLLITYFTILIIVLLIYKALSLFIDSYFNLKIKQVNSPIRPIILGLTILTSAFIIRNGFGNYILDIINKLINNNTHLDVSDKDQYFTLIGDIVFYSSVTLIVIVYIYYLFRKQQQEFLQFNNELSPSLIEFPENDYIYDPIFHQRVKKIFELKYNNNNLELKYDSKFNLLYGGFNEGFHAYKLIVFCIEGYSNNEISIEEVESIKNMINNVIKEKEIVSNDDIKYIYIISESSDFKNHSYEIVTLSENQLLFQLIDFDPYLKKIVHNYKNKKLPFSHSALDKNTLSDTYILPRYFIGKSKKPNSELHDYLNIWLKDEDKKHIVLLGDYGLGKSSFLKYYSKCLAESILRRKTLSRFPVLISLTNISPRHEGIENSIGRFISDNLGVKSELFYELMNRGKLVFILDGFDEMGFLGTHDQRLLQLNAIWKLATKNNKILISGRPSYFPSEKELKYAFNIIDDELIKTPKEKPYFERIALQFFKPEDIYESLKSYYPDSSTFNKYSNFIKGNEKLLDLCKRPSMTHIVRELLPSIYDSFESKKITETIIYEKFINHWLDRQLSKGIVSAMSNHKEREKIIHDFFQKLAANYYLKGVEKLPPDIILQILSEKMEDFNLDNEDDKEGFEAEILTSYFIEIIDDKYKFVHKSFKDFFVAQSIIQEIKNKNLNSKLITNTRWNDEIIDFIYGSKELVAYNDKMSTPLLLFLVSNNQFLIKLRKIFIYVKAIFLITIIWFATCFALIVMSPLLAIVIVLSVFTLNIKYTFKRLKMLIYSMVFPDKLLNYYNELKDSDEPDEALLKEISSTIAKNKFRFRDLSLMGIEEKAYNIAFKKNQAGVKRNRLIRYYLSLIQS